VPAYIPAVNCLEVALSFTDVTGDENINKFNVLKSAPWDAAHITTMLDAFITWFTVGDGSNAYQDLISNTCNLVAVKGRDLTTASSASLVTNAGLPIAGSYASVSIAPGLTKAVTHRTGLAGKSFRGRTFLVGIPLDETPSITDGIINAGFMATALLAFDSLLGAVTAADAAATLVVLSRYGGAPPIGGHSVPRATGLMTPITSFGYSTLNLDFQRRRAPGHARHH